MRDEEVRKAGLYIHIPFCLSKCGYCHFYSVTSLSLIPDFLKALFQEMEIVSEGFGPFNTVYIGGGTPSLLNPGQIEEILKRVRQRFVLSSNPEITLEANPADLTLSFLQSLKRFGVNRLNIGVQSFNEKILGFLGRRHIAGEAISALEDSRRAGFDNIGLDLIYGVPGQDLKSWQETLEKAMMFRPEHLSCYELTVEAETPLGMRWRRGEFLLPGGDEGYPFFLETAEWLENAGYVHYEVSNFARGGAFASRHNQKYWNHAPYLGLGPAAHSFLDHQRWWNHRCLDQYIRDGKEGKRPIEGKETLTMEQLRLEGLFLGFRTKKGIHLKEFAEQYGYDLMAQKKGVLTKLLDEGLLSIEADHLVPTRAGLAVADHLALI